MNAFIDIYSKLIIAIISFIAPLIVYLLSVYSDGIVIIREIANEKKNQISKLLKSEINEAKNLDAAIIEKSTKELKSAEKANNRKSNLLNPNRQIYRIFSLLFLSLLLVMLRGLNKDSFGFDYSHEACVILMISSLISFISALLVLRQVAWVVIETKAEIAKKEREKRIELSSGIVSPPVTPE